MNANGGFTRSFRRKWDNPVFLNKQQAAVWAWMCDTAQWCDGRYMTKFGPIELRRGELLIAERELSEDFAINRNVLRALLQRMVTAGMIEMIRGRCPQRAGTVVHLVNYDGYQGTVVDDTTATGNQPEKDRKQDRKRTANGTGNHQADQAFAEDIEDGSNRKKTGNQPEKEWNGTENNEVTNHEEIRGSLCVSLASPPAQAQAHAHTREAARSAEIIPFGGPVEPLPDDWLLPDAWRQWAEDAGASEVDYAADRFHVHWLGKRDRGDRDAANSEAVWLKQWRGWINGDLKRERDHGRQSHNGRYGKKPAGGLAAYARTQNLRDIGDAEGDPDDGGWRVLRG